LKRHDAPKAARGRSSLATNKETSAAQLARELKEAREQLTATADVLKVISGSAFDLKLVLEALIESVTRLCGATRGHIFQFDGEYLRFAAACGAWPGFAEALASHPRCAAQVGKVGIIKTGSPRAGGDGAIRRRYEIVRCLLSGRRHAFAPARFRAAGVRCLSRSDLGGDNVSR